MRVIPLRSRGRPGWLTLVLCRFRAWGFPWEKVSGPRVGQRSALCRSRDSSCPQVLQTGGHLSLQTVLHHREGYFCCKRGVLGPIPAPDGTKHHADIHTSAGEKINGEKKIKGLDKLGAGIRRSQDSFNVRISPQQLVKGHQLSYTWWVFWTWISQIFKSPWQKQAPGPAPALGGLLRAAQRCSGWVVRLGIENPYLPV